MAVKKKAPKPKKEIEPEAVKTDLTALNSVLARLKVMIEGPGSVADRQALYDDFERAISVIS